MLTMCMYKLLKFYHRNASGSNLFVADSNGHVIANGNITAYGNATHKIKKKW